jgi:hypothetical protein
MLPVRHRRRPRAGTYNHAVMAVRNAQQLIVRERIERGIRFAAPVLDVVLIIGERVSRIAGRNDFEPEPARHPPRPSLGGSPRQA